MKTRYAICIVLALLILAAACSQSPSLSEPATLQEQPAATELTENLRAQAGVFPSPEELAAYGVLKMLPAVPELSRPETPSAQWGWGEYDPAHVGSDIAQILGSSVLYAASDYANIGRHGKPYWEQTVDQESLLALKQLEERIYIRNSERREIYSMRVEPDTSIQPVIKIRTVDIWSGKEPNPSVTQIPYVGFSSFVTIVFEGETSKETVKLHVRSTFSSAEEINYEYFQLRILE